MLKTCQKCGHPNAAATGDPMEACPECGAIYSRVAAAMAAKAESNVPGFRDSRMAEQSVNNTAVDDVSGFAERMREVSLYPTFRGLVRLIYLVWMVLAVLTLLGGVAAFVSGSGAARVGGLIGGVFFAVFFAVIAKVTREAALMLADLSDAAVHIASKTKA